MIIPEELIEKLKSCQKLVVLTGAGVSSESGIPTYRDALVGLWKDFDFKKLASVEGFLENPASVWGWYVSRRQKLRTVKPNPAHEVIAKLESLVPEFVLITQNVDDLHERAGSKNIIHLHGSITKAFCIDCKASYSLPNVDLEEVKDICEQAIDPPVCLSCGGKIRPGVVWFGEQVPQNDLGDAEVHCMEADLLLIIGTSGLVYPAANLPYLASMSKVTIVQINLEVTDFDSITNYNFKNQAGELMLLLYEAAFSSPWFVGP